MSDHLGDLKVCELVCALGNQAQSSAGITSVLKC